MTGYSVALTAIRPAIIASITAACTVPVYRTVTPPDVDRTRPWIVIEWPPGGQAAGNPICPDRNRRIIMRVRAVAADPDPAAGAAVAAEDAAQYAADQVAAWAAQPGQITAGGMTVAGGHRTSTGGVDTEGDTVNIVDDYTFTITAT